MAVGVLSSKDKLLVLMIDMSPISRRVGCSQAAWVSPTYWHGD